MAIEASQEALAKASLTAADIDGVIVATSTHFLQTRRAPLRSPRAGRTGISAFDIGAGCADSVCAWRRGRHDPRREPAKMLVIGTENCRRRWTCSTAQLLHLRRRAAAVVVGETPVQGIGPTVAGSDGEQVSASAKTSMIDYMDEPTGTRRFFARGSASSVGRVRDGQSRPRAMDRGSQTDESTCSSAPGNARINEVLAKGLNLRPERWWPTTLSTPGTPRRLPFRWRWPNSWHRGGQGRRSCLLIGYARA